MLQSTMSAHATRESSASRSESDVEKGHIQRERPLISQPSLIRHLNDEVSTRGTDILVLLCWFTTGFLDSTIFNGKTFLPIVQMLPLTSDLAYRVFVSMQTGNTVFLGLGASNVHTTTPPYRWLKSLSSLIAFLVGCFFFSRLANFLGPRRRLTFIVSFFLQTLVLCLAATLAQTNVVVSRLEHLGEDINFSHLIPIVLLSFQAPGQTSMARQVGFPEVSTVVVTSMIYDFSEDMTFFVGLTKNAKRNRRFAGFVAILIGAIVGGVVTVRTQHVLASVWTSAGIKVALLVAWLVWPKQR